MGHDHAHHGDANSYFTEQLFNIAVCAALGGVMVAMYFNGMLTFLFSNNDVQHVRVLMGGAGLLAVVLIRAAYVWFAVGNKNAAVHAHDHDHGDCGHSHDDCGHDHHHHHEHKEGIQAASSTAVASLPLAPVSAGSHTHDHDHGHSHDHGHTHYHDHGHSHDHDHGHDGHDHDHGWAPWRFVLLLLPVVLFFLRLPNGGIAMASEFKLDEAAQAELAKLNHAKGNGSNDIVPMTFLQLERAAMNQDVRDEMAGKTIQVTGVYAGNDPYRFTLQRYKLNCCAADAIPLKAVIALNLEAQKKFKLDPSLYQGKWVTVTGRLQFLYLGGRNEYITTVFLDPDDKHPLSELVQVVPPDPNPYAH